MADRFNDYEGYDEFENSSLSGESRARIKNRREKVKKEELSKRFRRLAISVAVVVSLAIGLTGTAINEIQDRMTIDNMARDYQVEVINPNTHRTDDGQHYFYDYSDIANEVVSAANSDDAIYLLDINIGDDQTDKVLSHTEYKSLDSYLDLRGYENSDEFQKDMRERLIIKSEINEKTNELERMNIDHPESTIIDYSSNKGGKI